MNIPLLSVAVIASFVVWNQDVTGQQLNGKDTPGPDTTIVPVKTSGLAISTVKDNARVQINQPAANTNKGTVRINCGCGSSLHAPAAVYIDGKLADGKILSAISPKDIKSLRILKTDSVEIDGKTYEGAIEVETKNHLVL